MSDLISRQAAIDAMNGVYCHIEMVKKRPVNKTEQAVYLDMIGAVKSVPSAQPTLYGYNIEYLVLIARVLQKEDLPPERIVEVLTDIGRVVAIVRDEFEEALRKAVEQCMT